MLGKIGVFHYCPKGLASPNIGDVRCSDLDASASTKMKNVAVTMVHEFTLVSFVSLTVRS